MPAGFGDYFQIVGLSLADLEEVFALYELSRGLAPAGFLAMRSRDHFCQVLSRPHEAIGHGVRAGERLVAYSICHRVTANPYTEVAFLSAINPETEIIYHGDGTVVHPAYQGRGLANRLFRLRLAQMARHRVDHMLGLIAVDNLASAGNAIFAGGLLVGLARDDASLNYVVYAGRLGSRLSTDAPPALVNCDDIEQQRIRFARSWAVNDLSVHRSRLAGRERKFCFVPVECNNSKNEIEGFHGGNRHQDGGARCI